MADTRIVILRNVAVPMSDGVELRADIWLRDDGRRRPVLLQRSPYDKSGAGSVIHNNALEPLQAIEAGFVLVGQDTRGRFASGGRFEPFIDELPDTLDTISWIRSQAFSDGRVMMYGGSYNGALQLHAAAENPDGLQAIAPTQTCPEFYEGWSYRDGALQLGFLLTWTMALAAGELARRRARGDDVRALESDFAELITDPWSAYARRPLDEPSAISELVPAYSDWLAHPDRDQYWQQRSATEVLDRIGIPALHVGGWWDIFLHGTLASFQRIRGSATSQRARDGQRLLIGPWSHGVLYEQIGEVNYGPWASGVGSLGAKQLEFFAAALEDRLADFAPVSLFIMGRDAWSEEDSWPPARAHERELYLRAGGPDGSSQGRLMISPPASNEPERSFIYDPSDPVPTLGGQTFLPGLTVGRHAGPRDQGANARRADVLVYTSDPLPGPLELIGQVSLTLFAATDAPDTDWTAALVLVEPDGRCLTIVDGIIRARYRHGTDRASPLAANTPIEYTLALGATALEIAGGRRLALHISSSNFPRFDRNSNHGGVISAARAEECRVARQTIFSDAARPSRLRLPVASGSL